HCGRSPTSRVVIRAIRIRSRRRLVPRFDGVPPYCLDRFVTLWRKVIPSLRFVMCLRLVEAIPLVDDHTLGRRRSINPDDLSPGSVERTTTGSVHGGVSEWGEGGLGGGIERFEFAYSIGFWLVAFDGLLLRLRQHQFMAFQKPKRRKGPD